MPPPSRSPQRPRYLEVFFRIPPATYLVNEVILYTLNLGTARKPVHKLELLVQTHGSHPGQPLTAVPVYESRKSPASSYKLACPGMSRYGVPRLGSLKLPAGLSADVYNASTVPGLRITLDGTKVNSTDAMMHIAAVGLYVEGWGAGGRRSLGRRQ